MSGGGSVPGFVVVVVERVVAAVSSWLISRSCCSCTCRRTLEDCEKLHQILCSCGRRVAGDLGEIFAVIHGIRWFLIRKQGALSGGLKKICI